MQENKEVTQEIKTEECHFCKARKEVEKELFWCPRLHNSIKNQNFYGDWVCLKCCRKTFFQALFDKNLGGSWCGSCAECDFPIAAILDIRRMFGAPSSKHDLKIIKEKRVERPEGSIGLRAVETGDFRVHWSVFSGEYSYYFGFKWNPHSKCIDLIKRSIIDGIAELVLRHKKLPVRKVILLRNTLTYAPLSWNELRKYYWSQYDIAQHHEEEEWMDNAPVIIAALYLNQETAVLEKETHKTIQLIKEKYYRGE